MSCSSPPPPHSQACFKKAVEISGFRVRLTGKMGVRTKYQKKETSQLVVEARSAWHAGEIEPKDDKKPDGDVAPEAAAPAATEDASSSSSSSSSSAPTTTASTSGAEAFNIKEVELEEDTILHPTIKFSEKQELDETSCGLFYFFGNNFFLLLARQLTLYFFVDAVSINDTMQRLHVLDQALVLALWSVESRKRISKRYLFSLFLSFSLGIQFEREKHQSKARHHDGRNDAIRCALVGSRTRLVCALDGSAHQVTIGNGAHQDHGSCPVAVAKFGGSIQ